MNIKASELSGKALDYAVALCEGYDFELDYQDKIYWLNKKGRQGIYFNEYPLHPIGQLQGRLLSGRKSQLELLKKDQTSGAHIR